MRAAISPIDTLRSAAKAKLDGASLQTVGCVAGSLLSCYRVIQARDTYGFWQDLYAVAESNANECSATVARECKGDQSFVTDHPCK